MKIILITLISLLSLPTIAQSYVAGQTSETISGEKSYEKLTLRKFFPVFSNCDLEHLS